MFAGQQFEEINKEEGASECSYPRSPDIELYKYIKDVLVTFKAELHPLNLRSHERSVSRVTK